jgi:muramidase (phage lysozyme)
MPVAYNPYDPKQSALLAALALSEVGGAKNAQFLGTGGADLSDAPRDEYGFPQWDGFGASHAAGFFQFQPGTWKGVAEKFGLNFASAEDQKAGAWYHAQDTFQKETGRDLYGALTAKDYGTVESALGKNQWLGARGSRSSFRPGRAATWATARAKPAPTRPAAFRAQT